MRRLTAACALLGLFLTGTATSALAGGLDVPQLMNCADHNSVKSYLEDKFAEVPVSHGLQADGKLLQVFASEQSGTWSMVATTPNGRSCIVAVGEAWQMLPTGPLAEVLGPAHPRSPS